MSALTSFSRRAGGRKGRESKPEAHKSGGSRRARSKTPLDATSLRDLALSYAARYATTAAKLEAYLARKIRERGIAENDEGRTVELDVAGLVARLTDLGYVDDEAYARSRARDLSARGYGARRIDQALYVAGVDQPIREQFAPGEGEAREAAALLAKKRRFGPYARFHDGMDAVPDPQNPEDLRKKREKQVAAMLRAGHQFDHVRFIMDASSVAMIEQWIEEARGGELHEPW